MNNANQKKVILHYLEVAYANAEEEHNEEMACRLGRALIAFNYDDMKKLPTWEEMFEAYTKK